MLELRTMLPATFLHFEQLSKNDFAQAKARGEKLSDSEGRKISEEAWASLLPQGQETALHHFETAWLGDKDVGMAWFKEERAWSTPYAYIYQIWIWDEYQGKGLGKQLMQALEDKVKSLGIKRLRLHVFQFNHRACELYESLGYETTNRVMLKDLA